jgi:hypothetical protein
MIQLPLQVFGPLYLWPTVRFHSFTKDLIIADVDVALCSPTIKFAGEVTTRVGWRTENQLTAMVRIWNVGNIMCVSWGSTDDITRST